MFYSRSVRWSINEHLAIGWVKRPRNGGRSADRWPTKDPLLGVNSRSQEVER